MKLDKNIAGVWSARAIKILGGFSESEKQDARDFIKNEVPEEYKKEVGTTCQIYIERYERASGFNRQPGTDDDLNIGRRA